jgi:predicted nuclease of predicted toxin-antitoxin system
MQPTILPMRGLSQPNDLRMPSFFADECVARSIVEGLIQRGLDVVEAKDVGRGDSDERVLALAKAAGRIVITHDWGFGEMSIRHGQAAAGVIILSVYALSAGTRERYAVDKVVEIADQRPGCLTVIEPWRVRRRPLTVL